jgi:4-amino-4-deoxy-L-arabinose transferase-like glycosyltransferase
MRVLGRPLVIVLIAAVGAAIRVVVAGQDVFADELSTLWIVTDNDFGGVLSTVYSNAEITPPLSFVAAWLTTQIDDTPELLRAASLVAGTLTIPVVYLLGARTVGSAGGVVAACFTALAPFMIYYSAEARGYALMMAFVAASTLAMLLAVDTRRLGWWIAYGGLSVAAVYTHYTCVFALAAQGLWLLWAHPEVRRAAIVTNVAAALAYVPWLPGLRKDFDSPTTDILTALQPFDWFHVRLSLQHWSIGYPYSAAAPLRDIPGRPALVLLALGLALALAGAVWQLVQRRGLPSFSELPRRTLLVFALALSVPVGAAIFSAVGTTTLFSTRNLAASWPGFALALATFLMWAGPRLRYAAVALAVASFAIGAVRMLEDRFSRPHYSEAAAFVERQAHRGDVVIDETGLQSPGPLTHLDPVLSGPQRVVRSRVPAERTHPFSIFDPVVSPEQATRQAVRKAAGRRIFLVTDGIGASFKRPFGAYREVAGREYQGILDVYVRVFAPVGGARSSGVPPSPQG